METNYTIKNSELDNNNFKFSGKEFVKILFDINNLLKKIALCIFFQDIKLTPHILKISRNKNSFDC